MDIGPKAKITMVPLGSSPPALFDEYETMYIKDGLLDVNENVEMNLVLVDGKPICSESRWNERDLRKTICRYNKWSSIIHPNLIVCLVNPH